MFIHIKICKKNNYDLHQQKHPQKFYFYIVFTFCKLLVFLFSMSNFSQFVLELIFKI